MSELLIHRTVDQQASRMPSAIAVTDGIRSLTYFELQRQAEAVAVRLRERGVGPEIPVPLVCERSIEAVVGILGILKAGGAYAPINPKDPEARIAGIIRDLASPVIVTQTDMRDRLSMVQVEVLVLEDISADNNLDTTLSLPNGNVTASTGTGVSAEHLAVIVYTSGTTGVPKGVEIPHRAVMARMRNGYKPRAHDLQKAPLNVVAHFSDLLVPLMSGLAVIVPSESSFSSGRTLFDTVARYGTTRMVFVPSQLNAILDGGREAIMALRRLDTVIVSGEALTPSLVERFMQLLPNVALLNGYGASEVAGLACLGEVSSPDDITVGSAIPGFIVRVLTESLESVNPGGIGEVYLGGAQVARGYRSDPAITAEHFIRDPFVSASHTSGASGSGQRALLYRTGDLAVRLADGRIRILGRNDGEVKVHGYRAHLHEIEAALERVANVRGAIVTLTEANGRQQIVAHILPVSKPTRSDAISCHSEVASQCPSYMVPNRIEFVRSFPLLPNGKIDRVALAGSNSRTCLTYDSTEYVPPETITERVVAELWGELLEVSQVSLTDDFFSLGGDSLSAQRFVLLAEDRGVVVTLEQLQEAPSLAALAEAIDKGSVGEIDRGGKWQLAQ